MAAKKAPKPRAPRLPRFSPTRINAFLSCPRAYGFQYDQGLRWGGTSAAQSFGGSLHRALQAFHDRGGAEAVSAEELRAQLEESWSSAGYASELEAEGFLDAGRQLLAQYHQASLEPGRVTVGTELTVTRKYEDFVLFGKIDRLDRRPDGALEVIDYKSGRRAVTEDHVRASLAMTVYQLLVAREHPGVAVYTGIVSLRTGERAFVLRSEDELAAAEAEIAAAVRTILADTERAPTPGHPCHSCPYTRLCPEGRAYLKANPLPG